MIYELWGNTNKGGFSLLEAFKGEEDNAIHRAEKLLTWKKYGDIESIEVREAMGKYVKTVERSQDRLFET